MLGNLEVLVLSFSQSTVAIRRELDFGYVIEYSEPDNEITQ